MLHDTFAKGEREKMVTVHGIYLWLYSKYTENTENYGIINCDHEQAHPHEL